MVSQQGLELIDRIVDLTTPNFGIGEPEPIVRFAVCTFDTIEYRSCQARHIPLQKRLSYIEKHPTRCIGLEGHGRDQINHSIVVTVAEQQLNTPLQGCLLDVGAPTGHRCSPCPLSPVGPGHTFGDIAERIQRLRQLDTLGFGCHYPLRQTRHGLHS